MSGTSGWSAATDGSDVNESAPVTEDPREHWDDHYSQRAQIWSGRVNVRLAEIAEPLPPGTALDLGCGEGADAVWLAGRGWRVVAADVSPVALQRAAQLAREQGVDDRIDFQNHDLAVSFPAGSYDLVSAQFLHSKIELDRLSILRRAAEAVAPGGVLAIVDHGAGPPGFHEHHHFPPVEEVFDSLALPDADWDRLRVESVERVGRAPDGTEATWLDNVIVLRRRGADR